MPCVLMYLVRSLVLVTVDFLEMGSLVKVSFKSSLFMLKTYAYIDINECATPNPCDINAVCMDDHGSFTCTCSSGYSGDGFTCQSKPLFSPQ